MTGTRLSADTVVVGAGVAGMLVARELVRAGRDVLVIERGGYKPHARQLADGRHELDVPTAAHNHEVDPATPYEWDYLYAVGGSSLHWGGVTPRFLQSDFEMRSRFGLAVDWPLSYADLEPFYGRAEAALGVAAGVDAPYPRSTPPAVPAHPYAPVDRIVAEMLAPYYRLPQARPTESIGGRPACCASGRCTLCPVDSRYSAVHTLDDERLRRAPGFELRAETVVSRLRLRGGRVVGLECVDGRGDSHDVKAKRVVLAANGFENPALLMRSGLGGGDVGRWLCDHRHRVLRFDVDRPVGMGRGTTISTGVSYALADGDWRDRRASMIVVPENRGEFMVPRVEDAVLDGKAGKRGWKRLRAKFERTLLLDTLTEDLPNRDRGIELSSRRDRFGIPLNRVHYPAASDYLRAGHLHAETALVDRLRPLGARLVGMHEYGGSHLLGACRMGESSGVVDPSCRHHEVDNLYVTGGSSFPTYSAVHPTLTIAALAIRLGDELAGRPAPG